MTTSLDLVTDTKRLLLAVWTLKRAGTQRGRAHEYSHFHRLLHEDVWFEALKPVSDSLLALANIDEAFALARWTEPPEDPHDGCLAGGGGLVKRFTQLFKRVSAPRTSDEEIVSHWPAARGSLGREALEDVQFEGVIVRVLRDDDGNPKAVASYKIDKDGTLTIRRLAAAEGGGNGTKMMAELAKIARASRLAVHVVPSLAAQSYYEKLGMTKDGPHYSWTPQEAARFAQTGGFIPPNVQDVMAGMTSGTSASAWQAGAVQVYLQLAMQSSQQAGQAALEHLGLHQTFEWAHPRAMAQDTYAVRGSKVIQNMYGDHLNALTKIITEATDPRHPLTISQVKARIAERWPDLQAHQVERIARTETAAVWTTTAMNAYRANGITQFDSLIADGPSIGVQSEDPCDECVSAAEEVHSVDDDLPPWHPNCRCEAVPVLEDAEGNQWLPPDEPWTGDDSYDPLPAPAPGETMRFGPSGGAAESGATESAPVYAPPTVTDLDAMDVVQLKGELASVGNRLSGLNTRIKKLETYDPKYHEVAARIQEEKALREEIKLRIRAAPPKPIEPPPIRPRLVLPDQPVKLALGDLSPEAAKHAVNTELARYAGGEVRVTMQSGAEHEGVVALHPNQPTWAVGGEAIGAPERVMSIEVKVGEEYKLVAEQKFPTLEELQTAFTSAGNKISGLRTRLKGELNKRDLDHEKLADIRSKIRLQEDLRASLKTKIEEAKRRPPPPPPPTKPYVIPLTDALTEEKFHTILSLYEGKTLRLTYTTGGETFGRLVKDGDYWTIEGGTLGNGRGVQSIELFNEQTKRYDVVAERPLTVQPEAEIAPVVAPSAVEAPPATPLARDVHEIMNEAPTWEVQTSLFGDIGRVQQQQMETVIKVGERIQKELDRVVDPGLRAASDKAYAAYKEASRVRDEAQVAADKATKAWRKERDAAYERIAVARGNAVGVSDLVSGDPAVLQALIRKQEASRAWESAASAVRPLLAERSATAERALVAERSTLLEILGKVRSMGPGPESRVTFAETGARLKKAPSARKVLTASEPFYPTKWLADMRPINAGWKGRGHHLDRGGFAEIYVSDSTSFVSSDPLGLGTAIHELGHEVESVNRLVVSMERAFYDWRTRGGSWTAEQETLKKMSAMTKSSGYGADEVGREDKFAEPYMGKDYGRGNYELLTMGVQSMWTGKYGLDAEYRNWILGLLATA